MVNALFYLDRSSSLNLQTQIWQKIVDGINNGVFPSGTKLPSSRKLAEQLEVSRTTVVVNRNVSAAGARTLTMRDMGSQARL